MTVVITTLTIFVFVMVMGIFQVVTQGLALSRERLGADAILVPKYASATGSDLLFTALPENIYMDNEVLEQAKELSSETISTLQRQLEAIMKIMFALWMASLLIAILALTGRFNALAKERKKEIGLLRAIGLRKGQVFGLIIGETCTMALMGGILGSGFALLAMDSAIELLREAFTLSPSVWSGSMAVFCGGAGVALAALLGFVSAVSPALKSASMDPQTAITQGEVN